MVGHVLQVQIPAGQFVKKFVEMEELSESNNVMMDLQIIFFLFKQQIANLIVPEV